MHRNRCRGGERVEERFQARHAKLRVVVLGVGLSGKKLGWRCERRRSWSRKDEAVNRLRVQRGHVSHLQPQQCWMVQPHPACLFAKRCGASGVVGTLTTP